MSQNKKRGGSRFTPALIPYIIRLRWESFLQAIFLGFSGGMIVACMAMLIMRLFAVDYKWWVLFLCMIPVTIFFGLVGYFIVYRLSYKKIIRRVDAAGMQQRLITMMELSKDNSYIAKVQRQDTIKMLKKKSSWAVRLHLPIVASVLLISISVSVTAMAVVPPRQTRVPPPTEIPDDYQEYDTIMGTLSGELNDTINGILGTLNPDFYPDIPQEELDNLKDLLGGIMDSVNDLLGNPNAGDTDKVGELEGKLEELDKVLNDRVTSPLLSDYLASFSTLKALASGIKTGDTDQIHNALYAWCFDYHKQLDEVIKLAERSNATPNVKEHLANELKMLRSSVTTFSDSFAQDRKKIQTTIQALKKDGPMVVNPEKSVERAMADQPLLKDLSAALLAGDEKAIEAAMVAIEAGCKDQNGDLVKANIDALIEALNAVFAVAEDQSTEQQRDDMWNATDIFLYDLRQVSNSLGGNNRENANKLFGEAFRGSERKRGVCDKYTYDINATFVCDREIYQSVDVALTRIYDGSRLSVYLWNEKQNTLTGQGSSSPVFLEEYPVAGLGGDIERALFMGQHPLYYYTESPLVLALVNLSKNLKGDAGLAKAGNDALFYLRGPFTAKDLNAEAKPHETHDSGERVHLALACDEIVAALQIEELIKDVIEDVRDPIQDAVDDLLGKEEEEEDEEFTGIDNPNQPQPPTSQTPTQPPEDSSGEPSDDMESDSDNSQSNSGGSVMGDQGTTEKYEFYNPVTGKVETLTRENLDAMMEDIIANEKRYDDDDYQQMIDYYNTLLLKLPKSEQY